MATNAQSVARYWASGSNTEEQLEFTPDIISRFLVFDWLPHLASIKASDFMGWPALLTEPTGDGTHTYLGLQRRAGASERQWSGFLSWMVGVAAARHVLDREGYQWVAPSSAFYPEARDAVAIDDNWPEGLMPGTLEVRKGRQSRSPLRPDYLAVRRVRGRQPWQLAFVEAKGTRRSLENLAQCPKDWRNQVRNGEVWLADRQKRVARHLVVATRSNPKAVRPWARRFQIRAWNSEEPSEELNDHVARAIAVAQLYGLARNLNLPQLARGIVIGELVRQPQVRVSNALLPVRQVRPVRRWEADLADMQERIDTELRRFEDAPRIDGRISAIRTRLVAGTSEFQVEVDEATATLMRRLAGPEQLESAEFDLASQEIETRTSERRGDQSALGTTLFPGVFVLPQHRHPVRTE